MRLIISLIQNSLDKKNCTYRGKEMMKTNSPPDRNDEKRNVLSDHE